MEDDDGDDGDAELSASAAATKSADAGAANLHAIVDISIPHERRFVETNRTRSKLFIRPKSLVNDQGRDPFPPRVIFLPVRLL